MNELEELDEIESIMQEPAGGENHGWASIDNPEDSERNTRGGQVPLGADGAQQFQFLRDGGWSVVDIKSRAGEAGMKAHRGILHEDEYVDSATLRALIERRLGFTYEQIRGVYRQGPLSNEQRELRAKIDARLLALSRAGGTMVALARSFGWTVNAGGCQTMTNALARARAAE